MFKAVLTTENNRTIYLEYDKEKYDIEYVKSKNVIILRRLSDKQILEIFNDKIGFIVQNDSYGETNFVITDYSEGEKYIYLKHFVDKVYSDKLILKNQLECDCIDLQSCRVTDKSFIVEQDRYSGCLYNLNRTSKRFDHIYNDKRISEIVGEDILMVSENKRALGNSDIKDTLTYGINPETYEIVTPIWSEMQQRYINIYTEEQMDKVRKQLAKEYKNIDVETCSSSDITIHFEIGKYLEILASHFTRNDNIYLDFMENQVNKEFVKKFVRK